MSDFERSLIIVYLAGAFAALALMSMPMAGPIVILVALALITFCALFLARMGPKFGSKTLWGVPSLALAVSPAVWFWMYLADYYNR